MPRILPHSIDEKPITKRFFCSGLALLLGMAPGSGEELALPGGPLREPEAIARALGRGSLADVTGGSVEEVEASVVAARRWQNPVLSFTFEQAKGGGGGNDEGILFLQQTIEPARRRQLRTRAAEAQVAGAEERAGMLRIEVEAMVREVFFSALAAQERVGAAEDWDFRMARVAEVVALRKRAGDASGYDLRRVAREQATVTAAVSAERAALAEFRERLQGMVGRLPELPIGAPVVAGELLPHDFPAALTDLLQRLELRPDIQALREEEEAARLEERVARGWKFPSFTIGAGIKDSRTGGPDQDGPVAYAAFPLPILDQQQGPARRAAGRRRQLAGSAALLLQEAQGAVRGVYTKERQLVSVAERFREAAQVPAEDLLRTAEASYKAGEIGVLSLLDAYRSAYEARTRFLELALGARRARIELDRMTGGLEP